VPAIEDSSLLLLLKESLTNGGCGPHCGRGCLFRFCGRDPADATSLVRRAAESRRSVKKWAPVGGIRVPKQHQIRNVSKDKRRVAQLKVETSGSSSSSSSSSSDSSWRSRGISPLALSMVDDGDDDDARGDDNGTIGGPAGDDAARGGEGEAKRHKGKRPVRLDRFGSSLAARREKRRNFLLAELPELLDL
jgi:hypothetical protein